MQKIYKIYSVIIFLMLALPGLFIFILPQHNFSSNENRYLNKLPGIKPDEILSGSFQEKVSDAFNDQFFARGFMTGLSTSFKKSLGFKDIGGAYLAKDNYYIEKITDNDISKDQLVKNLMYLSYFATNQEADVYTMLVPSPGTSMEYKLPAFAPFYNAGSVYNTVYTVLGKEGIIDLRKVLKSPGNSNKASSQDGFYFKTDHHWTLSGAYAAYNEYCKTAGIKPQPYNSFNPVEVTNNFYGTTYSKVLDFTAKPDSIYAINTDQAESAVLICDGKKRTGIYSKEYLDKKDKYSYFFGGNYGRTDIVTGSNTELKLLVLKDSFANSFVPFLLKDYSQITMIDARYYDSGISGIISSGSYDHILILYEINNFAGDKNLYKLLK